MKILIGSYRFSPDVGGIETVSALLATEFVSMGNEVKLMTTTAEDDGLEWPFEVLRQPTVGSTVRAARWCDVFFQSNISLQSAWAGALYAKPWVVAHQTWIVNARGNLGWREHLKRFVLRFATNVAVSCPIADTIGVPSIIVGNPYQDDLFRNDSSVPRDRDLVFLGRLVSDKGVALLVEALAVLRRDGIAPGLTIIGSGPEESAIRALVEARGVNDRVEFVGVKTGPELARLLNRHEVMVVPSLWAEPFGVVALEGIACGCVVVGSENGGLKEAIGPCGLTFPNGDLDGLVDALRRVLGEPELRASLRLRQREHLARFKIADVAREYLDIFASAAQRHTRQPCPV